MIRRLKRHSSFACWIFCLIQRMKIDLFYEASDVVVRREDDAVNLPQRVFKLSKLPERGVACRESSIPVLIDRLSVH